MIARSPDGASATKTTCSWLFAVISSVTAASVPIRADGTVPRARLRYSARRSAPVARLRIGVQLSQQDTTIEELRTAWREADELGVDTIWVWDHFFPLYGDPNANHFEGYSLLGAM